MVSEWEGLKGEQKNNFSKQRTPYGKLAKKKIGTAWSKFKIDLSPSCDKVTCLILGGWSLHTSITCYIRWVKFFMTEYVVTAYTTRSALKKTCITISWEAFDRNIPNCRLCRLGDTTSKSISQRFCSRSMWDFQKHMRGQEEEILEVENNVSVIFQNPSTIHGVFKFTLPLKIWATSCVLTYFVNNL